MIKKNILIVTVFLLTANFTFAQDSLTNSIGMKFKLIKPGTMLVGKFQPTINRGGGFGGGRGGQGQGQNMPAGTLPQGAGQNPGSAAPTGQGLPGGAGGQRGGGRQGQPALPEADYKKAEEMANKDAMPGFEVKIEKPYYIGKFEVTQGEWKKVMGTNPSIFQGAKLADPSKSDMHPVENVSWQDAQNFIKKLNKLEKGEKYRLPTEFEWEYAARAGATDDIPWGEIRASAVIATKTTAPVGTKNPNAWGLNDTLGNVWEWVEDFYNEKIFADPTPPKSGKEHVLKGAPFYGDVKNATYMTHAAGPGSKYDVGFRVVLEAK